MGPQLKINSQRVTNPDPAALGIIVEKPKFPDYADKSKRLESYATWPDDKPIDKHDLAEAGLVYTGEGDNVRCFFCGGGLRNWEHGDNPMEEHARWFPKCAHILLVKGQQYVDKINHGDVKSNEESTGACGGFDRQAEQDCVDMGFSREVIERAKVIFKEKHGNVAFNTNQLCEILCELG
ncbi:death-associated inhibitor of apoptosis 1-like [Ruditapes philippinarum]|uniref:death-associated inhibitor of apoptosis 1-like n=1 Tax=Ruditapes philippinarum TaxID=129788 RepID=UPI00295B270D|nr:death-associated inhibitor of apoptosis 1-like [Ruditapes philippinarum]